MNDEIEIDGCTYSIATYNQEDDYPAKEHEFGNAVDFNRVFRNEKLRVREYIHSEAFQLDVRFGKYVVELLIGNDGEIQPEDAAMGKINIFELPAQRKENCFAAMRSARICAFCSRQGERKADILVQVGPLDRDWILAYMNELCSKEFTRVLAERPFP